MTSSLQPLRDLLVVEKDPVKVTTSGGIILVGAGDVNTVKGRVVSTGPGTTNDKTGEFTEIDIKVGDEVLFHAGAGLKVSAHKELPERLLLREDDILAIVI